MLLFSPHLIKSSETPSIMEDIIKANRGELVNMSQDNKDLEAKKAKILSEVRATMVGLSIFPAKLGKTLPRNIQSELENKLAEPIAQNRQLLQTILTLGAQGHIASKDKALLIAAKNALDANIVNQESRNQTPKIEKEATHTHTKRTPK